MSSTAFVIALALPLFPFMTWCFRSLPRERFQVIASIPTRKDPDGTWRAANLTWYGLLSGTATAVATLLFLVLLGAIGVSTGASGMVLAILVGVGFPSARLVARIVERKSSTLTIGGAVCVACVVAPFAILAVGALSRASGTGAPPLVETLAALSISYALGEAVGRLACLSFGCCYGKPLRSVPERLRRPLARLSTVYHGSTKKIAYASGLAGVRVVPVQATTSLLYSVSALAGTYLFLEGHPVAAYCATMPTTQLWRVVSESLRADYRGASRFSVYQRMALFTPIYLGAFVIGATPASPTVDIAAGLEVVWRPDVLLLVQALWLGSFAYTGWSKVTGSVVSFHVRSHRV